MINEYYNSLAGAIAENNLDKAKEVVMSQVGSVIANQKDDFIHVLRTSGIPMNDDAEDYQLVESFLDNLANDNMLLNVSIIVNTNNKVLNFDGEPELSDVGVKSTYKVLSSYFNSDGYSDDDNAENNINEKIYIGEKRSNGWGDFANNLVTTGAGIYQDVKNKKTAGQDTLNAQKESRNQLVQSIIAQKQAKVDAQAKAKEQKEKTNRTILIVGGISIAVVLLGGVYLAIKKRGN